VWQSADVVMDRYLDGLSRGGVFNSPNLNLYAYGYQNPVKYSDPNGKWVETAWDVFNIGLGVASFVDNVRQGNYGAAALDAVGVVADTVAAVAPIVPGGVGTAIKAARAADAGVDALKTIDRGADLAKGLERTADASKAASKAGDARSGYTGVTTCSFAPDTLVMTRDGLRPISTLKAGEYVLARDDQSGLQGWKRVLIAYSSLHNDAVVVTLTNRDTGEIETILTTAEHPFYVEQRGWLRADALAQADRLMTVLGGWLEVSAVTLSQSEQVAYNLEVEEFHTYFVGESGVWVHNACDLGRIVPKSRAEKELSAGIPEAPYPILGKLEDLKKVDLNDPEAIVQTIYSKKLQQEKGAQLRERFKEGAELLKVDPKAKVQPAGRTNMGERGIPQYKVKGDISPEEITRAQ
jgi:hypothetical protein